MSTKLYIRNQNSDAAYPTGTVYGDSSRGGYYFLAMGATPSGAGSSVTQSKVSASGSYDIPTLLKAASAPAPSAGTLDGTVTVILGGSDSVAGNDFFVVGCGKIDLTGNVVGTDYSTSGYMTATGRGWTYTTTISTPIAVAAGERLYIDVTAFFDTTSPSGRQLTAYFGGTGSDLVDASTAVGTNPPTVVYSSANVDKMFGGSVGGAAQRGMLELF